jgi:hypothetical protein
MESDPQKIWQNQKTEKTVMSIEEIREKLHALETKKRIEALTLIVVGLLLCPGFGLMAVRVQEMIPRIGWCGVSLWCLFSAWRGYRLLRAPKPLAASAPATSLEFYRGELEKRRDRLRKSWGEAGLTWLFAALALIILPEVKQWLRNGLPFLALLTVWLVAFFLIRKRQTRRLREEIEALSASTGP